MDGPGMTGQAQREKRASDTVRQTRDMVAMMNPLLGAAEFVFCATNDAGLAAKAQASSLGWFNEGEGTSLILERSVAEALGFAGPPRDDDAVDDARAQIAAIPRRCWRTGQSDPKPHSAAAFGLPSFGSIALNKQARGSGCLCASLLGA